MVFIVLNGYILNGYINTYVISVFSLAPQSLKYLWSSLLKFFCLSCRRRKLEATYYDWTIWNCYYLTCFVNQNAYFIWFNLVYFEEILSNGQNSKICALGVEDVNFLGKFTNVDILIFHHFGEWSIIPLFSRAFQRAPSCKVLCCQIVERKLSFSLDLFLTNNSLGENGLLILPLLGARNLLAIPRVETAVIATTGLCWAYHLWFFSGGKEGEWLPFSMGCTGWFLGLQCVCITCCLKCLFLELECDSHPFVLSISFFFFSVLIP